MFTSTTPYIKPLGDGLVLKSLSTPEELDRLAAFNLHIHGEDSIDTMTRRLVEHHPHTRPEHWLFVENESTGQIVSSLCLIPWSWCVAGAELKAGEMGIVGTHPDYRRRGLVRALVARFKELLREGGYHLSQIQGLPYYYRQFGYEYALPLEGGWEIGPHQVPGAPEDATPAFGFRRATPDDVPALVRLYDAAARDLDLHAVRDTATWRYLLEQAPGTAMDCEFWLVLDADGTPAGYWCIQRYGFGSGLNISEVSRLSHAAALAVLRQSKTLAAERDKPYIRYYGARDTSLRRAMTAWGAREAGRYAWQIHLPDVGHLLRALAPAFEQRIAASEFAGLTDTMTLNLYREAFELRFEDGRLREVAAVGFCELNSLSIPPNAFVPLVLGYRSRAELERQYPDLSIWGQSQVLADVLFPPMTAQVYTIY